MTIKGNKKKPQKTLGQLVCMVVLPLLFLAKPSDAQSLQDVDLELVLALDCSTSVDDVEFELQKQGLVRAFLHPNVIRAISAAGNKGIAISVVQWSGRQFQTKVVDWTLVKDRHSAAKFSKEIAATNRQIRGMTSTAGAIGFSVREIADNNYLGRRKTIDVSGDGTSNPELSRKQRDFAVSQGVTVNGLVIFSKEYDLGELADINVAKYYSRNVIGGKGAFLMAAKNYKDFQVAIRKKLVREISGLGFASR